MTFNQIMTDLRAKRYKPIYLLEGEEPYYIDLITDYIIKNVLTEAEKSFNLTLLYGKDVDIATVDNIARRFPMMCKYQVVIVKEAQNLKKIEDIGYYAQKPLDSTILVFSHKHKTVDKRKKFIKDIEKNGVYFESKKLYENQVPDWIYNYLKDCKREIDPIATKMLTDFLGTELGKIANELDKLIISIQENKKITPQIIEENIGISKDYNNFELNIALTNKDILKANRIIDYFGKNQKENNIIVTITSLFYFFVKVLAAHCVASNDPKTVAAEIKVNPYFVKDYITATKKYNKTKTIEIISILREYDLKSKGVDNVSAEASSLLKELIYKILH